MEQFTFIDRYFRSQFELLDIRHTEERNINTLFTYLENLHSTADKLKSNFGCSIKDIPEFKLLRIIRNYFHHVGDIDEFRYFVSLDTEAIFSHLEHVIIPTELFAKGIKSFIDNNTVSNTNRNYQKKLDFVSNEIASILLCCDCQEIIDHLLSFCNNPRLRLDGVNYSLGFDIYKFIYNITNIIADRCRDIENLKSKEIVANLDWTYTQSNNIERFDLGAHAASAPILTTKGFVFATQIEKAI